MRNPQEPRDVAAGHLGDDEVSECAFSPEHAAPGVLEHAGGCAECSARIEELSRVLASLAELPEPEIPESVLIRLDATVERAWQEADAETQRNSRDASEQQRRRARTWKRLAVPVTALGVFAGAIAGIAYLAHDGSTGNSAPSAASAGSNSGTAPRALNEAQLTQMASSALRTAPTRSPAVATQTGPMAKCFVAPPKTGYAVAAVASETYSGREASLVVYRNDEAPASTTTFFAVLYAGACPETSSQVLDEGFVSISR